MARQFAVVFVAALLANLVGAVVLAVVLVGLIGPPGPAPAPAPAAIDAAPLGRAFAPVLARTYAEAWEHAASDLDGGKSMDAVLDGFKRTWQDARTKAFDAQVGPAFDRILPAGTEPTAEQRTRLAATWRSFAKGLRGAK